MEDIFKSTTENEGLYKISIGNGVGIINFATSKNLSKMYSVPIL
jgi:hypothetical protein